MLPPRAPAPKRVVYSTRQTRENVLKSWFGEGSTEAAFTASIMGFVVFFVIAVVALYEWLIVGIAHKNTFHFMSGFFWFGLSTFGLYRHRQLNKNRARGKVR